MTIGNIDFDPHSESAITLAIVESFQALEIYIENYLAARLRELRHEQDQIETILDKNWRTKDRLNSLLYELKSKRLNEVPTLWDPWCLRYDQTRNEVLHQGKNPTDDETSECLELNKAVIEWLKNI